MENRNRVQFRNNILDSREIEGKTTLSTWAFLLSRVTVLLISAGLEEYLTRESGRNTKAPVILMHNLKN